MAKSKKFKTVSELAAAGGNARAAALSPVERSAIAKTAADARWGLRHATHEGVLNIAGRQLECSVLDDGRRVLGVPSFMAAIGRTGKPMASAGPPPAGSSFTGPVFLAADNLIPFIGEDLRSPSTCVSYRTITGRRASGYEARLLPLVCDVYLAARQAKVLTEKQTHVAEACELLVRGLAQTGIVALVDEATGYQEVRDRRALQAILDQYLRQEFAEWAKRFPDEFYKEMFRLRGWTWRGMNPSQGPRCVAKLTNNLVYARLSPGIVEELETRNPVGDNGKRKAAHHQWLTEEIGHPALTQHIHTVVRFMRAADTWEQFIALLDRAEPVRPANRQQTLFDD